MIDTVEKDRNDVANFLAYIQLHLRGIYIRSGRWSMESMANTILKKNITLANQLYIFFYYKFSMKPKYVKQKSSVTGLKKKMLHLDKKYFYKECYGSVNTR